MLSHLSWTSYFQATALLLVIYYLFISLRFYRNELHHLFNRVASRTDNKQQLPEALQYREQEAGNTTMAAARLEEPMQETPSDNDHLTVRLKACISQAADKPFAPAVLIVQLKKILQDPAAKGETIDRELINARVVNECEKTGTALLTEDEVDQWWSD
jgi:hypothetical protein